MQPLVRHLSILIADAILAGHTVEDASKAPQYARRLKAMKRAPRMRHQHRPPSRIPSRKVATLPPDR